MQKGLKPGETVVTEGQLRLEPGSRVTTDLSGRGAGAGGRGGRGGRGGNRGGNGGGVTRKAAREVAATPVRAARAAQRRRAADSKATRGTA